MEKELDTLQNVVNTATAFVVEYGFQILGVVIIHVRYAVNQAMYKALKQARLSIAYPRLAVYAKGEHHP